MQYQCVHARFLFFNGFKRYTVEYAYGLTGWFIFEDEKTTDAVYTQKINPALSKTPTRDEAELILENYLDTQLVKD